MSMVHSVGRGGLSSLLTEAILWACPEGIMCHSGCLLGLHVPAVAKAGKFLFLFKRCGHVALINPQGDLIVNPSELSLSCMLP